MNIKAIFLGWSVVWMVQGVAAQDVSKRMDPEAWFAQENIEDAWEFGEEFRERALRIRTAVSGHAFVLVESAGQLWVRDGDLRLVVDTLGQNWSRSHNVGFNYGAYHFGHHGHLMSLGGGGFWERHSKLIEFIPKTGEWEWLPCSEGPRHVKASGCWKGAGGTVWAVEEPLQSGRNADRLEPSMVWSLDLASFKWTARGRLSDTFNAFYPGSNAHTYETKDYVVWVRNHQSVLIRKEDRLTVLSEDMIAQESKALWSSGQDVVVQVSRGNQLQWWKKGADGEVELLRSWDVEDAHERGTADFSGLSLMDPLEDTGSASDESTSIPAGFGGPVMALAALLFGTGVGFTLQRRRSGVVSNGEASTPAAVVPQDSGQSSVADMDRAEMQRVQQDVAGLETLGEVVLTSQELNVHLNMGEGVSAESRRARRAQFVRDVNREYQVRHGADLIFRERDPEDRRRTNYVIRPRSSHA